MQFLTIINYTAMGIGYLVLALALAFIAWLLVDIIKEKHQRRKWEKEREDKEKTEKILSKESKKTSEATASSDEDAARQSEEEQSDEEKLVGENGQLKMMH